MFEYLITGQSAAARPAATRVALQRGTLPQHPAAYGYGGPGSPSLSASDPMASIPAASSPYAARRRTQLTMLPEPGPQEGMIAQAVDPSYQRQVVPSEDGQCPGTIVVDTTSRHLYLVQPGGRAIRYGIGVGRPGFLWRGIKTVSQKREWPDWTPPAEMLRRRPDLPRHMEGGDNPLGARALSRLLALPHPRTNEPHTIGQAVSSGCIRMMNEDVVDLYERAPVGARVKVI